MKMIKTVLALSALSMVGAAFAGQIDVIDSADAQAGTYFVPTDAQKGSAPYYRAYNEDWSWTHNALTDPFATAELNISAYDVDFSSGELDEIFAYDTDTATWISLGYLQGGNNIWQFTAFGLNAALYNEVATGLQVRMDIDVNTAGWLVTLAKSTLTTDGVGPGNPNPTVPDSGTSALLLGIGLVALLKFHRQRA